MGDNKKTVWASLGILALSVVGLIIRAQGDKVENNEAGPIIEEVVEPTFQGIKESVLTQLAQTISRGERVKVLSEKALIFYYKSKRGRQQQSTKFVIDEDGKLIRYVGMGPYEYANVPKFFQEKLLEILKNR